MVCQHGATMRTCFLTMGAVMLRAYFGVSLQAGRKLETGISQYAHYAVQYEYSCS